MPSIHETNQALANWTAFAKENPLETMVLLSSVVLTACNEASSTGFPTPEATATDAARATNSGTRIAPIDLSETAEKLQTNPEALVISGLVTIFGASVLTAGILHWRNRKNRKYREQTGWKRKKH